MKGRSGLTLVELLLSLGLAAVLLVTASSFFWQAVRSWKIMAGDLGRQQCRRLCLARVARDIRSASQVLPSSTTEEVFILSAGEVLSYRLLEQKLRRKKAASSSYLSGAGEIRDLSFSYPSAGSVIIHSGRDSIRVLARN